MARGVFEDLTGRRFGSLTALRRGKDYISPSGKRVVRWLCQCDCGNYRLIQAGRLRAGRSKSCGCLRSEFAAEAIRKHNRYEFHGNYIIGITEEGDRFVFDTEDYDKIKDTYWCMNSGGYVMGKRGGRCVQRHRLVTSAEKGSNVDHLNHRPEDNRKVNLRVISHQSNIWNGQLRRNNTSGCTGVSWDKARSLWSAHITKNGKKIYLGRFSDYEDAVSARKAAEERYFGVYSYANSMALAEQNGYVLEPA